MDMYPGDVPLKSFLHSSSMQLLHWEQAQPEHPVNPNLFISVLL